ncbi:hypothetical protein [Glycocaulis sp.]|uniref:hypothetical protein n=1 Tax=Glycocaulis sp. TaxID=1969725 RepID=UPI003D1B8431
MSVKPPPREAAAEALHILRESHPDPKAASPEAHALAKTLAEDELEALAQAGSGHSGKRGAPEELPPRRSGPERSDGDPR